MLIGQDMLISRMLIKRFYCSKRTPGNFLRAAYDKLSLCGFSCLFLNIKTGLIVFHMLGIEARLPN
jgi:hypothetical protein